MGVVSRQIVPVCSSLCCFCPSLRSRSRHPIKRYKQLIAEILPRNQEAEPNDRKIGKLCEYASKNPLRIPKINSTLEQRFYKELRYGNFGSVKVVMCIYSKLISSCREQMPLFAATLLGIVRTLLEQSEHDELQIVACYTLVDFINNQTDATHVFNLEGLVPTLCQLAGADGGGESSKHLRSAGLQSLASMVSFMGEQSHVSMDFDKIVSVVLENYIDSQTNAEKSEDDLKKDVNGSAFTDDSKNPSVDISNSPSYWSRICLLNMAKQAKEVTTIRRILELLFNNFDVNNHWSLEKGVAYSVLMYLQCFLEETGENSHVLLSMLVKHLDHKNVCKQPLVQIDMVKVAALLAEKAKQEITIALLGAIFDLMKHLRKCLQNSAKSSNSQDETQRWNADLQIFVEKCILQLSKKVGDVGPILDGIAMFLENVSSPTVIARMTISAALRTVHIISSIPNISYQKKAFPDALFHQLLIGMAHPDPETRVKALDVFSAVLMPPLPSPQSDQNINEFVGSPEGTINGSFTLQDEETDENGYTNEVLKEGINQLTKCKSRGHSDSFKNSITNGKSMPLMRVSSHQIDLLLSSIWVQASSPENVPANFEAIAQAYNIALLFTRFKASSHVALVRCFQLAISLRRMALDQEDGLPPSRRRSLINLASYMLIFSAKAANLPELIPLVKASLTEKMTDPYLQLVDDIRLKTVCTDSDSGKTAYGSEDDNITASKSLSVMELDDHQLKEAITSQLMMKFENISEDELSDIKKQLLQEFSPDDSLPLGPPIFMDTPQPCSPLAQTELQIFERVTSEALTDDEAFSEPNRRLLDRKTSLSTNADGVLSVNELLQSVSETAQQVTSSHIASTPVPYDQMKDQCEALVTGKKEKMSILQSFKHQPDSKIFPSKDEKQTSEPDLKTEHTKKNLAQHNEDQIPRNNPLALRSLENGQSSFRLPPASPYEKFLKGSKF